MLRVFRREFIQIGNIEVLLEDITIASACRMHTIAERYERTMMRIEHITRAGYQVEEQWECEFDEEI